MACVVETGNARNVAKFTQTPAESREANIPSINLSGSAASKLGSTIPLLIVLVTYPPASAAPRVFAMIDMTTACLSVMAPEPTEVPIAFARSLAPILAAK